MPTHMQDVQSYSAGISLSTGNPFGRIVLTPSADFHGQVHPVTMYFFENTAFNAYVVGSDPFTYNFYVITSGQTLFSGLIAILERSGPKHVTLNLEQDIPATGGFTIKIDDVGISTDTLAAQFSLALRTLPEQIQKLLPPKKR